MKIYKHSLSLLMLLALNTLISHQASAQTEKPLLVINDTISQTKNELATQSNIGAAVEVTSENFNKGFIISPEELIQGRVAGLQVTSASGMPGQDYSLTNQGISTLITNSPIIVVNGLIIDTDISSINPNDVETITVLKDGWATALYGDRAAHGAVVITTKRGTKELKATFKTTFGLSVLPKAVDVFSADEFKNYLQNHHSSSTYIPNQFGNANTDWQKEIYQTASGHDTHVNVTGTFLNLPFSASLGNTKQNGIIKTTEYKRNTASFSLNPSFFENHLLVNLNFNFAKIDNTNAPNKVVMNAVQSDPTQPIYNADGSYNFNTTGMVAVINPVAQLNKTEDIGNAKHYTGNVGLEYKLHFLPDLKIGCNIGQDKISKTNQTTYNPSAKYSNSPYAFEQFEQTYKYIAQTYFTQYTKQIDALSSSIDLVIGYNKQEINDDTKSFSTGTYSNQGYRLSVTKLQTALFGRFGYTLKNRYSVNLSLRNEETKNTIYASNEHLASAIAIRWNIKNEPFLTSNKTISALSIGATYSKTGTNIPSIGNSFFIKNKDAFSNPGLTNEEINNFNLGIDYGFFGNRLFGSINYYSKRSANGLIVFPSPTSSFYTSTPDYLINGISINNEGLEFSLSGKIIELKDWQWEASLNLATNSNEVSEFSGSGIERIGINDQQILQAGYPVNSFYVYEQLYDASGNPIEHKFGNNNQRHIYNDSSPKILMGISSKLNYKNWDLSFSGRLSLNNYVYNTMNSYNSIRSMEQGTNATKELYNSNFIDGSWGGYFSDYFVEDASFFRMDFINLGYSFDKIWNNKLGIHLMATVQNAFVLTQYKGVDPEIIGGIDGYNYPRPRIYSMGLKVAF